MSLLRPHLPDLWTAEELKDVPNGTVVSVGGSVITRQRPGTAKGFCFLTLEDETGHANAIVTPQLFEKLRMTINMEASLIVIGKLQNVAGVIHVKAERILPMPPLGMPEGSSHDYR